MEQTNVSTPATGWTPETILAHITQSIAEGDRRYQQRFVAQEKAVEDALLTVANMRKEADIRYEQRFIAQEKAVVIALATVDKEFHEHLAQVREETRAALSAAEKAIGKAEASTEKRFESVNEFRAQLNDQVNTFIPRKEAEGSVGAVVERLSAFEGRSSEALARVHTRLDLGDGSKQGATDLRVAIFGAAGFMATVIGIATVVLK